MELDHRPTEIICRIQSLIYGWHDHEAVVASAGYFLSGATVRIILGFGGRQKYDFFLATHGLLLFGEIQLHKRAEFFPRDFTVGWEVYFHE